MFHFITYFTMSRDSEDPAIERDEPSDPLLPYHLDGSVQNPRRWFHLTNENCNEDITSRHTNLYCS